MEDMTLKRSDVLPVDGSILLPSDYIHRSLTKGTTINQIKNGYMSLEPIMINITDIYNWYVANIEKHINALSVTRNTTAFSFLVDCILINSTIDKFLLFQEGTVDNESMCNYEDIANGFLEFLNNNNLPVNDTSDNILIPGIEAITDMLHQSCRQYLTNENSVLPIGYNKILTETYSKTFSDYEIKTKYPNGVDIFLKICLLNVSAIDIIVGDLDNCLNRCIYGDKYGE